MATIPHVLPARVGDIALGFGAPERLLTTVMGRARGELLQELHTFASPAGHRSLESAIARGVRPELLVNPRNVPYQSLRRFGDSVRAERYFPKSLHGELSYQHSKLLASTKGRLHRPEAVFTNVSLMHDSAHRADMSIRLVGDSAEAAHTYLRASFDTDLSHLSQAAHDARSAGLLVNEPRTGTSHLADAMRSMVDTAEHRIHIVSKGLDDADFAARLVQARERGVDVTLTLRDLARADAIRLHEGGVRVVMQPMRTMSSRINMLVADDLALASTSYQWTPMLTHGGATSRESGVLLAGRDAARAVKMLGKTSEGAVALAGAEALAHATLPEGFVAIGDILKSTRLIVHLA